MHVFDVFSLMTTMFIKVTTMFINIKLMTTMFFEICARNFDVVSSRGMGNRSDWQIGIGIYLFWRIYKQKPSVFNSALKSMINLISDWRIRSTETGGRNNLGLMHIVDDFMSRITQPDVFSEHLFCKFSQNSLENINVRAYILHSSKIIFCCYAKYVLSQNCFFRILLEQICRGMETNFEKGTRLSREKRLS